jgi:hypothetical protein
VGSVRAEHERFGARAFEARGGITEPSRDVGPAPSSSDVGGWNSAKSTE